MFICILLESEMKTQDKLVCMGLLCMPMTLHTVPVHSGVQEIRLVCSLDKSASSLTLQQVALCVLHFDRHKQC